MILRLAGQGDVSYRSLSLLDLPRYGVTTGLRGFTGGAKQAAAIPALHRAARIRAEAVASLQIGVYRGEGVQRVEESATWQSALFSRQRMNEYQTRFGFWEALEESLSYRNKAYAWKLIDPDSGIVLAMFALHPDQVTCLAPGVYRVKVSDGYIDPIGRGDGSYTVGEETILPFRGHGNGGGLEPLSPVEVFRESISAQLSRQRYETKMWDRGASLQFGVEFPDGVTPEKAEVWRKKFDSKYGGLDGATTAVVGGGATLKPIGMTMADAEFVSLARLTVEDASRIMGVPARLLGQLVDRNVPLEQDLATWLRFGIGPEFYRIESALSADDDLFPDGSDLKPMFKTEGFVRGDLITEAKVMHLRVQDGTITPDEGRAELGYEPHPGGIGAIPQVTPVGGAPNASLIPVSPPKSAEE